MIEIQGVIERDPLKAVSLLLPRLGRRLVMRYVIQALCLLVVLAATGVVFWRMQQPPPPWEFGGRVTDSETKLPISDVKVAADDDRFVAYTDSDGKYILHLPQPRPKYVHLVFAKHGYKGEEPVDVNPERPFDTDMTRLK